MPVRRDRDGNVIDEKTHVIREDKDGRNATDIASTEKTPDSTLPIGRPPSGATSRLVGGARTGGLPSRYDRMTLPVGGPRAGATAKSKGTVVLRGGDVGPMSDPPVGWLVVVEGPGMGNVLTLGIGFNAIGRGGGENRVSIDYGDEMISRNRQCVVAYDKVSRKFYVQHGDGTNLTYIEDQPVLTSRELLPFAHIRMGATVLRFVPLCGEDFHWPEDGSSSGTEA